MKLAVALWVLAIAALVAVEGVILSMEHVVYYTGAV